MAEMLKHIFFDLDGTITDPKEGITKCIQYALISMGRHNVNENDFLQYIGPPLRSSFSKLLCSNEESLIEEAVNLYRERFSEIGIFENAVYPGIAKMLSALCENSIRLYVVTTKPKIYADRIIEHFQLAKFFDAVYGSKLDGSLGNKVKRVKLIMNQLKLVPEETAIVGDRKFDIVAGKLNSLRTIAVTYGYGSKQEIVESAPDYICDNPDEIRKIVLNLL